MNTTAKAWAAAAALVLSSAANGAAQSATGAALAQLRGWAGRVDLAAPPPASAAATPLPSAGDGLPPALGPSNPMSLRFPGVDSYYNSYFPGYGYGPAYGFISMLPAIVNSMEVVFDRINRGFAGLSVANAGPFDVVPRDSDPSSMTGGFWGWKQAQSQDLELKSDRSWTGPHFDLHYRLVWSYGGRYKDDKAQYLHGVTVVVTDATAAYMTKLNVQLAVSAIGDVSSDRDQPVAGLQVTIRVLGEAPSAQYLARMYTLRGDSDKIAQTVGLRSDADGQLRREVLP